MARNRNGRELEFYGSPNELKRNEAAIVAYYSHHLRVRVSPSGVSTPPSRRLEIRADKEFASWLKIEMLRNGVPRNDFYNRTRDNITENGTRNVPPADSVRHATNSENPLVRTTRTG